MSTDPITDPRQLVEYFANAARPAFQQRIICAHEKFAYRLSNLQPVGYNEAAGLYEWMLGMEEFGWSPVRDSISGDVTTLMRGHASITLEAGGQVRLIGAPLQTLHETSAEIDQHLMEVCEIGGSLDIGFMGIGFHPTASMESIRPIPKMQTKILQSYFAIRGKKGADLLLRSAGTQVGLHYHDEADMAKKFRLAVALQPIASAIFASSPFTEGQPNGFVSGRLHALTDTDTDRCGLLPFVFEKDFGFESYADYALNAPMISLERDGQTINCAGQSFRDFLTGKLPALPGEYPTLKDWGAHLAMLYPDVRLRKTIEMRGADSNSSEMLLALPSFWTGLLYDSTACDAAWQVVKDWTFDEHRQLHEDVVRMGFQAEIQGQKVFDIAQEVLILAQQGLRRRVHRLYDGADETRYLDVLFNFTESQQSKADQMLMQFQHFPEFTTASIFEACRLLPPPDLREDDPEVIK